MAEPELRFVWWKDGPNVISAVAMIAAASIAWSQLTAANEQLQIQTKTASASYVLKLSEQVNGDRFSKIMSAIEDHQSDHSLVTHGFKAADIGDYVGRFETIGALVHYGVVTETMAYDEFSYDIEKAYCNEGFVGDDRVANRAGVALGEHVQPARRNHADAERHMARIDEMDAHQAMLTVSLHALHPHACRRPALPPALSSTRAG